MRRGDRLIIDVFHGVTEIRMVFVTPSALPQFTSP